MSNYSKPEIFIGIVAPIGTKKERIIGKLKKEFKKRQYEVIEIKITNFLFRDELVLKQQDELKKKLREYPKSFQYFLKMELCTKIRKEDGAGFLAGLAIKEIKEKRSKNSNKGTVYLIDQIKNIEEYKVLSTVYDINYIQISIASNKKERNHFLEKSLEEGRVEKFRKLLKSKKYEDSIKEILNEDMFCIEKLYDKKTKKKLLIEIRNAFEDLVYRDSSEKLLKKDFDENGIKAKNNKHGQQIANIFHESHYFFNADLPEADVQAEVEKFMHLLFGTYDEYPTQDEFGMALATLVSPRSTFPGGRHVGASIIAENGEVISAGSIRAPISTANTTKAHEDAIREGYRKIKKKIESWGDELGINEDNKKSRDPNKDEIWEFIDNSIDFHPCTHAEISAILDANKLGVPVKGATLYTTTFPCHLCARDIITSGIKRVVFCEAYPKSRNEELYNSLITIDESNGCLDKLPLFTFVGIGPKRYGYVYRIENKKKEDEDSEKEENNKSKNNDDTKENEDISVPPFLKYRPLSCYHLMERLVYNFVKMDNKTRKESKGKAIGKLTELLKPDENEKK